MSCSGSAISLALDRDRTADRRCPLDVKVHATRPFATFFETDDEAEFRHRIPRSSPIRSRSSSYTSFKLRVVTVG